MKQAPKLDAHRNGAGGGQMIGEDTYDFERWLDVAYGAEQTPIQRT